MARLFSSDCYHFHFCWVDETWLFILKVVLKLTHLFWDGESTLFKIIHLQLLSSIPKKKEQFSVSHVLSPSSVCARRPIIPIYYLNRSATYTSIHVEQDHNLQYLNFWWYLLAVVTPKFSVRMVFSCRMVQMESLDLSSTIVLLSLGSLPSILIFYLFERHCCVVTCIFSLSFQFYFC